MYEHIAAVSPSYFDSGWYLDIVRFAQRTPWLHAAAQIYTVAGFVVLALLLLAGGLLARHSDARAAAAALAAPVGVLAAFAVNEILKSAVREIRPCDTLHVTTTVLPCDPVTDFSFPSNHTAVAVALAVALLLVHRKLGWTAVPFALLMGLSRVYVGAHYPHDVLAAIVLGAIVALLVGLFARAVLAGPVERLRPGRLGWLLGAGPAAPDEPAAGSVSPMARATAQRVTRSDANRRS
ncbi:MAG: phosphatase PAP2 family protein [Sciscionella sp.]